MGQLSFGRSRSASVLVGNPKAQGAGDDRGETGVRSDRGSELTLRASRADAEARARDRAHADPTRRPAEKWRHAWCPSP